MHKAFGVVIIVLLIGLLIINIASNSQEKPAAEFFPKAGSVDFVIDSGSVVKPDAIHLWNGLTHPTSAPVNATDDLCAPEMGPATLQSQQIV